MPRGKIGRRFTLVLPKEVREGLAEDDVVEVVRREDGVIEIRPQILVDRTQAWFWTDEWQRREREADADYATGRYRVHDSTEDFIASLRSRGPIEEVSEQPEEPAG